MGAKQTIPQIEGFKDCRADELFNVDSANCKKIVYPVSVLIIGEKIVTGDKESLLKLQKQLGGEIRKLNCCIDKLREKIVRKTVPDAIDSYVKNGKNILDAIDSRQNIVEYIINKLSNEQACDFQDKHVKIERLLGKGENGKAYSVSINGLETIVLKTSKKNLEIKTVKKPKNVTRETFFKNLAKEYGIQESIIKSVNKHNFTNSITVPKFATNCSDKISVMGFDGKLYNYKSAYICKDEFVEFVLSLLGSELFRRGKSINFLQTFYFSVCPDPKTGKYKESMYMEKIDTNVEKIAFDISENEYDALLVQALHAIHVMQKVYKMNHNDLTLENLFLKRIEGEYIIFGNKKLSLENVTHFCYKIEGSTLCLPRNIVNYIVKIADWNYGCKYSSPAILNNHTIRLAEHTVKKGEFQIEHSEGESFENHYATNYFSLAFDPLMVITQFHKYRKTEFNTKIAEWCYKIEGNGLSRKINKHTLTGLCSRPISYKIDEKFGHVSARNILVNKCLMRKFSFKNPYKFIILGTDK